MTFSDIFGLLESEERLLVRVLQLSLVGLFGYGLVTLQVGMALNGASALTVTLLPVLLRRKYGYSMDAGLILWITIAIFLHSFGALGPYRWYPWYDILTHTHDLRDRHCRVRIRVLQSVRGPLRETRRPVGIRGDVHGHLRPCHRSYLGDSGVRLRRSGQSHVDEGAARRDGDRRYRLRMIFNTVGAVIVAVGRSRYLDGFSTFLGRRLESNGEQ